MAGLMWRNLTFHLVHYMKCFKLCRCLELVIGDKFDSEHQSSSSHIPDNCIYIVQSSNLQCRLRIEWCLQSLKAYGHVYLLVQLVSLSNRILRRKHCLEAFLFRLHSKRLTLQLCIQGSHQRCWSNFVGSRPLRSREWLSQHLEGCHFQSPVNT